METIAIALLSLFGGGLISFLLGTVRTDRQKYDAFVIIMVLCLIVGPVMLILSWQQRKDTESVIKRISARGAASAAPQATGNMLPQANMVIDVTDEERR